MRKTFGVMALIVIGGAGLAACGDDSKSSSSGSSSGGSSGKTSTPEAYVEGVCGALSDIVTKATDAQTAFTGASTDPAKLKQQVQSLVDGMAKSVTDAKSRISALGAPKATDGTKAHQALLDALTKMESGLKEVQASAATLDPASATSAQGFQDVATKFSSSMDSLGSGLDGLKSPELEAAAKKSAACKKLGVDQ